MVEKNCYRKSSEQKLTSVTGDSFNINSANLLPSDSNQELLIAPFVALHVAY